MKRYRYQSAAHTNALRRREWPFSYSRRGMRCVHCNTRYKSYADYLERDGCSYRGTACFDAAFPDFQQVHAQAARQLYEEAIKPALERARALLPANVSLSYEKAGEEAETLWAAVLGPGQPVEQTMIGGVKARTFTWAPPATEAEARATLERGSITSAYVGKVAPQGVKA